MGCGKENPLTWHSKVLLVMADGLKVVHILVLAQATIRYILFDVIGDVGLDVLHNKINDLVNEV